MQKVPLYRLFPNVLTLLALCLGITSINYTFQGKFELSIIMILVAALMDGLDGSAARLLKSSSEFGAQLDSLADLVSFGVAPALLLYQWQLSSLGTLGWFIILIYSSCIAIRLARYNVEAYLAKDKNKNLNYFYGLSSPCAALLVLSPLVATFQLLESFYLPKLLALYLLIISLLAVSRIPTFSTKSFKISKEQITLILALFVIIITGLLLMPWIILPIFALLYFLSLPLSWFIYREKKILKND